MSATMMTLSMTRLGQKPSSSCKTATRMYPVFIEIGLAYNCKLITIGPLDMQALRLHVNNIILRTRD